jgi:predicted ribosomally synthesized peptide with SipW-like signal peptide
MTITKTLKTKLVLGILAAAASLTLAVGGTLMLFTDTSETATNVVTIGQGLSNFALQEKGGVGTDDDTKGEYKTVVGLPGFDGIDFGDVLPNATLVKQPRVIRSDVGGAEAYLRVKYTVKAEKDDKNVLDKKDNDFNPAVAERVNQIILTAITGNGWVLVHDTDTQGTNPDLYTGYYYYGNINSDKPFYGPRDLADVNLVPFEAPLTDEGSPSFTGDIFQGFKIPETWGENDQAIIEGYKITVELQAQAVQKDYNEQTATNGVTKIFSDKAFADSEAGE